LHSGYNPPNFIRDAAKLAVDRLDCNQYAPTTGRPRLKEALSDTYSPFLGRRLDPATEIAVTTGANEGVPYFAHEIVFYPDRVRIGMLSVFMAFVEPGDEVVIFEPYFDQ
jgi:kynurenine aminotransferase